MHIRALILPSIVLPLACSGCDLHGNGGTGASATDGGPASTTGASAVGSSGDTESTGGPAVTSTDATTDGDPTGSLTSGADATTMGSDSSTTGTTTAGTTGDTTGGGVECAGDGVAWVRYVPNSADVQFFTDLVADPDDNLIAVGNFWKQADFGGGPLVTEDPWAADGFVVKYGPQGEHLWSRQYGGVNEQRIGGVALAGDGSIIITGTFRVTLDFGSSPLEGPALDQGFVAKLSPTGEPVWAKGFGNDKDQDQGIEVAADSEGNIVLVAGSLGPVDFGDGPHGQDRTAHVVKFDPDGDLLWHRAISSALVFARGVAVDANDDIVVGGEFKGSPDFGAGPVASKDVANLYLMKLNPEGQQVWFRQNDGIADFGPPMLAGLATDGVGNIHVGGLFSGQFGLGGPMLQGKGELDAWVAKLNPDGGHLWSSAHGSGPTGWQLVGDVAANDAGETAAAGSFMGTIAFADNSFSNDGDYDTFAARFGNDGVPSFSRAFGDHGAQFGDAVEIAADGSVWLGGAFANDFSIGDEKLVAAGNDGYLARICP